MGRPKELGSNYGTDDHYAGRDPLGQKAASDVKPDFKVTHKYKGGSPLSTESNAFQNYLKSHFKTKTREIIADSLRPTKLESVKKPETENHDKNTFLDENNIISN